MHRHAHMNRRWNFTKHHTQSGALTVLPNALILIMSGLLLWMLSFSAWSFSFDLSGNNESELLPAEQAFALQVSASDAQTLVLSFDTQPGYYLYQDKIKVETDTSGVTIGALQFPPAERKQDPNFGEMLVFHDPVMVQVPLQVTDATIKTVNVTVKSQGCADIGVCYPPMSRSFQVTLPAGGATPSSLQDLNQHLGLTPEEPLLPPDQAFQLQAKADGSNVVLTFDIAPDYYLYQQQIKIKADGQALDLTTIDWPEAEMKKDVVFGEVAIYRHQLSLTVPVMQAKTLEVRYQGCADAGVCYPPENKTLNWADLSALVTSVEQEKSQMPAAPVSETDALANLLQDSSVGWILLTFFGLGLLLAFTPCVFPMIPILSSIIAGQGANTSTKQAFVLSLIYVLAMALTYTIAGVIAGLLGANIQVAFQNPWVLGVFSLIFVLLALSMFGFYELQVPSGLQNKLNSLSNQQKGGTYAGVAIMGFLSALIVGPCMAPPLAGALIYIGQSGDAVLGGAALFALSMGMGVPLLLVGTTAGKYLPRAGNWMTTVTRIFGVLLLAVAIWMLSRILPDWVTFTLWLLLIWFSGLYMGALLPAEGRNGWGLMAKGFGLLLMGWAALMLVGLASGGKDVFQPIKHLQGNGSTVVAEQHLVFDTIKSVQDLDQALAEAKSNRQLVMLDFYADWCTSCIEMERFTFSDATVIERLANAKVIQADVTANDAVDQALMKRFGIVAPPAILFFDPDTSEEIRAVRVIGYQPPEQFLQSVDYALSQ